MKRSRLISRTLKIIVSIAAGSTVFATSCGEDLRNTLKAAGLDFVKSSAGTSLSTFIPVKDILTAIKTPQA